MSTELESRIQQYIADADCEMGVAIHHIESGEQTFVNPDKLYPMASVIKVPILVEAFHQMADNRLRLDDRWTFNKELSIIGSGILPSFDTGLTPTVRDLLTLMIIISDNTATDMLFERLDVKNVNQRMKSLGIKDVYIPHTLRELFIDLVPDIEQKDDSDFLAAYTAKHGVRTSGWSYRQDDTNNAASARGMARLFEMIWKNEMLDKQACDGMLSILLQQTLNDRIPRFLPSGTLVAHKTGTIWGVRNDSGIIYAGKNAHVIVSLFAAWDAKPTLQDRKLLYKRTAEIDGAMGNVALAAYETYLKA